MIWLVNCRSWYIDRNFSNLIKIYGIIIIYFHDEVLFEYQVNMKETVFFYHSTKKKFLRKIKIDF